MKQLSLALAVLTLAAPMALAQTDHSTMDHSGMDHSTMTDEQLAGMVHTSAVVNSLGDGTANITHGPIPEIGWPAMTMDLAVMPDAAMTGDIKPGDAVSLMLIKGDDGMYAIGAMMPE
jgi:Cu/Ag efflux protein CusF